MTAVMLLLCLIAYIGSSYAMTDADVHARFSKLFTEIAALKDRATYSSSYCSLLKKNVCGPCTCFDDYRNEKKYICDCQMLPPKRDCLDFLKLGYKVNGIYKVTLNDYFGKISQVFCDQTTDGGGWTVIQRRTDGTENFFRNWNAYKYGFGDIRNEFWFGNDLLHKLIYQGHLYGNHLRFDLKNFDGKWAYAKYGYFKIGDEYSKYQLHVGSYSGNASDSLTYHNGMKFSTYDQDNDAYSSHCALTNSKAAWWYKSCSYSDLNGMYTYYKQSVKGSGIYWNGFSSGTFSQLKWTEMKVRRKIATSTVI